ncbi:uncharacterized protein [Arachis hypogaea]|uniref:uncharacterized protein n=1 Tax=Arachis hypogaea TaxID=3818 RepID=UPI000DEC341D|nr:uncharacterized protein LOC112757905 [Arachis hypogaea]
MYPTPITQSKIARLRRKIILARKRKRLDDNESAFFGASVSKNNNNTNFDVHKNVHHITTSQRTVCREIAYSSVQGPVNNLTEVVSQNQLPSHSGFHRSCLTERSSTMIGVQKGQSSSVVASVAINLAQLYEDVNLSTVKTHLPSADTHSGQRVDPLVDDEVLNGYDDSMLDVDMEDNFIPSSEILDDVWDIGNPIYQCQHCKAWMWSGELPLLSVPPDELIQLHTGGDQRSIHFLKNIRTFNSMFCFTSMAGKIDRGVNNGTAPPIFKLGGQNYHSIGSLLPPDSLRPTFAQLYIYDTENEIDNRIGTLRSNEAINERDREIVAILRNMLDRYNSLAKSFRYARDRYQQENCTNIKLKLISKRTTDGRTYNLPSASEVAALIVGDVEQLSNDRDIIIESQSRKLQRIDVFHPSYLALQYPLLFPYGEDGFRLGIATSDSISARPTKKNKTITLRQFFAFRLQKRTGESPLILRSKRLFQQFLVDAYTMVESERLKFFRCKQPQLRVDKYKCLHESLINGDVDAARLGKRIILPSTFTGGPRYAGYPSYFITMTCNPEWDEIRREVTSIGLKAEDRPDILCRVFKIKLDGLIDDLKEGKIFGKILGYVCTVEFQKRGLPHAHILLFMSNEFKPQTPDDIDKHITAEIPDENERPNLHRAVQNYMVHGPCGPYNKNSPCMKNGSCSKFYPKEFRQRTLIDEAGFPKYRRTDNGRTVKKRECVLDNKFIVPYNPELLLKFGCHINVEYTCQTSSIKYLFKYVHKGNDRVTATLYNAGDPSEATQVVDEIRNYYDCRYISACEAVWRLFGYEIQEKEPFVIRLPFHLEDEQPVVYGETSNVNDIVERAISHRSMFLGWMEANMSYPYARSLTYAEFPTKFVWKDDSSKWFPRKKGFAIGRLTHVPAANTEEYYQRLLLNTQRGCTSFRDIRTVGGIIYATYRDACFALGLLQDDKEFIDAIKEASSWASGSYVRRLFVILLTSNNISRPEHVWDRCWHELSDDILYQQRVVMNMSELTMSDDEIKQLCLMDIDKILHSYGKTLKDYPPMPLATEVDNSLLTERVIREELNFNRDDLKKNASDMLAIATPEQRYAFDKIVTAVYCDEGGFFFVYGHGGTGKTFLWNLMSAEIRSRGDVVLNVASSGIASLLLPNGRTAHSRFKIPLNITEDSVCNIKPGSPQAMLLLKAKLIIWDEAPMVSRYCYEALDKCLGDIMRCSPTYNKDLPFGGKVVVLGGDFRQILPVIPRGSRQDIVHSTVNSSYLWKFCQVLKLTKNMRLSVGTTASDQDETEQFGEWLLKVGDGLIGDNMDGESEICLPGDIDFFKTRTILAPTLDIVEEVNNHLMAIIPGGEKLYLSSDSICMDEGNMESQLDLYGPELLNSINCSGLPPHKLILKVGVPVMLLRNIDQSSGLCNGTRLQVRKLGNHVIECEVLTGNNVGHIALIPRMNMVPTNETVPVRFQRRQFPIIVSFAMTINKSQGQTLSHVGLYLPRPVFTHGQLYVALSRVKSKRGLKVLLMNHVGMSANSTINVVYREVFEKIVF